MENRRRDFRHVFSPTTRLKVALTSEDDKMVVVGRLVNLSVGGLCLELADLPHLAGDRWIARLILAEGDTLAAIRVERVHTVDPSGARCGFRFLFPATLHLREQQEKVIWRFMLNEQRQERQRRQEAKQTAG